MVSCPKTIAALEPIPLSRERAREEESPLTPDELHGYRSLLGTLNFIVTWHRGDLQCAASLCAQRTQRATVQDAKTLNALARDCRSTPDVQVRIPRGKVRLSRGHLVAWGDSAFANAEGEKSQYGNCFGITEDLDAVLLRSDFSGMVPLGFRSATVKRVVRSTLAAEAYGAVSYTHLRAHET